jgi:hypothetical protein
MCPVYPWSAPGHERMNDSTDGTKTSRRTYLRAAGGVGLAGVTGLAGCLGGGDGATGTLSTAVTDAPGDISDFESCVVTIEGFWLKDATDGDSDDDTETTDGDSDDDTQTTDEDGVTEQDEEDVDQSDDREYHEYDEPQEADLVQLQDGETQLVDDREIDVGSYAYLQLDVSGVDGTLSDGGDADVGTPGSAPLQFKHEFEVREDQRTTFTADFTPVQRGQTGKYLLQPVATGTDVSYEETTTSE